MTIDINELRQLSSQYVGLTAWTPIPPQELIELLDRLEAAEKEYQHVLEVKEIYQHQLNETEDERDALRALVDILRAENEALAGAQKVQSVPKKIERVESGFKGMFLREAQAYKRGWNECRGAMLAEAPNERSEYPEAKS